MVSRARSWQVKEKEARSLTLRIELKDFGPITNGSITLRPLTLFIGPNNSGKSYAATLIHSLFQSYIETPLYGPPPFLFIRSRFGPTIDIQSYLEEFQDLTNQIARLKEGEELELPEHFMKTVNRKILEEVFETGLGSRLIHSFASELKELTRMAAGAFELRVDVNSQSIHLGCEDERLRLMHHTEIPRRVKVEVRRRAGLWPRVVRADDDAYVIEVARGQDGTPGRFSPEEVMEFVARMCMSAMLENIARPCYYLPAARSGILQAHRALAASIVEASPYFGLRPVEIPRLSGIVADFISSILILPDEKGPLFDLAQELEKELIKGEIVVSVPEKHRYPEISYRTHGAQIPLHRASSSVSELAPLFLYLRYKVEPGNVLIVEEPEAHLHPENQRIVAKLLTRLVRKGINVIITTHSEYLLEQLSNFILLSKVSTEDRAQRYRYGEDDFLKMDEVGAYVFSYDPESEGHKIAQLEITEEGISEEEFARVYEVLYEETFRLRRTLVSET